jgi:hypothetical protein
MSGSGITFNYAPCLGTATWNYVTNNESASTNFKVCSVALNNVEPLNLLCSHDFFSKTLTKEENDKFIIDLTAILNTINAKNITIRIRQDSPLAQSIFVNYEIDNVPQDKVDSLTTTIASVCKKAIDDISFNNNCSNSNVNGSASVIEIRDRLNKGFYPKEEEPARSSFNPEKPENPNQGNCNTVPGACY